MKAFPQHWTRRLVGELFDIQLGKMLNSAAKNGEESPYLTNFNVQWGRFDLSEFNTMHFSIDEKEKFSLQIGDLLVCEGGEVGRCAIWKGEITQCFYQKALHRLRPKSKDILPEYMLAFMQFIADTKLLGDLTSRSSIAHLTREKFIKLSVAFPSIYEQERITVILETWTNAIFALESLITTLLQQKRGLMQQLLSGQKRFKELKNKPPWKKFTLGELFTERIETSREDLSLVSITGQNGVVPRNSLSKRDTSSEDKSKYLRIAPGDIGYNTMRMWQGVSGLSKLEGIVSPAYTVCIPSKKIDGLFAAYLFKHAPVINLFRRYSQGLVDDTLALKFYNFAQIHITIPDVPEQRRIAEVLETCDKEINLLQKQLELLKEQKRGLMQKLLTGEIRVKVPKGA